MKYKEAVNILKSIDRNGYTNASYEDVAESIIKVLSMATINATPKYALRNTLAWLVEFPEYLLENDLRPFKHRHWLICSDGYYPYCSGCKHEPNGRAITNYCENCGAKMDEVSEC